MKIVFVNSQYGMFVIKAKKSEKRKNIFNKVVQYIQEREKTLIIPSYLNMEYITYSDMNRTINKIGAYDIEDLINSSYSINMI